MGIRIDAIAVSVNIGPVCWAAGKSGRGEGRARHPVRAGVRLLAKERRAEDWLPPSCPDVSISM